jgi:hypothetical protein
MAADWDQIIGAWPPCPPVEVTDDLFCMWIAERHLKRVKRQFTTSESFDKVFLRVVAAAVKRDTPIADGQAAAAKDLDGILQQAAYVHFRGGRLGDFYGAGALRELVYFALVSAHQNSLAMLAGSRATAISELSSEARFPAPAFPRYFSEASRHHREVALGPNRA